MFLAEFYSTYLAPLWMLLRIFMEISLLSALIYLVLLFLRGTRGAPILAGFTFLALILSVISSVIDLEVLSWLLTQMWTFAAVMVLIIFQPEIRRAFAELGAKNSILMKNKRKEKEILQNIVEATFYLAERKIGALIAIERDIGMRVLAESGTTINAELSKELLSTFFYPNTPLHDGGVIIRNGTVLAAGCFFPLTQDMTLSKALGTRHRAGVGVTEETDCVCIVVSEETGAVNLAYRGKLARGINAERLQRHLNNLILRKSSSVAGNVEKLKQVVSEEELFDG